MQILTQTEWLRRIQSRPLGARASYRAMYSTWWDGLVTDPSLMLVPVDDHQVHRGDAVFEAIKFRAGGIYLCDEHLARLEKSAAAISLASPKTRAEIQDILRAVALTSGLQEGLLRLFLSRGPGSFSSNPYETLGPQLAVIATELKPLSAEKIASGVSLAISKIPAKEAWQARIKSCNYLSNVLMKKEAVDLGVDFSVALDARGMLTESSTENIVIVDASGVLTRPRAAGILAGTVMNRAFELAAGFVPVAERDLSLEDLRGAREVLMAGTTIDVIAVTTLEDALIGGGTPGLVTTELRRRIIADQASGGRSLAYSQTS